MYCSRDNYIAPGLGSIPLYRHISMLLLCGSMVVVALSFYAVDFHAVLWRICHIRLHVRVLFAIYLNHLEEMDLIDLTFCFIFSVHSL